MVIKTTLKDGYKKMTAVLVHLDKEVVEVHFANETVGWIPFGDLALLAGQPVEVDWENITLENEFSFRIPVLGSTTTIVGHQEKYLDIPWDFARSYADPKYAAKVEWAAVTDQFQLAFNVYLLRMTRNFSQEELAKRAGLSRATINRIENRQGSVPNFSTLQKIVDVLGVGIAELFNSNYTRKDFTQWATQRYLAEYEAFQSITTQK